MEKVHWAWVLLLGLVLTGLYFLAKKVGELSKPAVGGSASVDTGDVSIGLSFNMDE